MYSAKIYYTKSFHTGTQTVENILKWESDENGGVTITFGDYNKPTIIERHRSDIEDIYIYRTNPTFL